MSMSSVSSQHALQGKIVPIILCGGFGRRLWPVSRPYWPKPFLSFGDDRSLLQKTASRFSGSQFDDPIIICNEEHRFGVATQLQEIGITPQAILLEPKSAGTTAAILFASHYLKQKGYQGTVVVTPADHYVESINEFQHTVSKALPSCQEYDLILIGVSPSHPSSEYGYLTIDESFKSDQTSCQKVKSFIEKPSKNMASSLINQEGAFWNAGIFIFDNNKLLKIAANIIEKTHAAAALAVKEATVNQDFIRLGVNAVASIRCPSFDISIVQNCSNIGMVELTSQWRDMGTWKTVWESFDKDPDGNVHIGNTVSSNVMNSLIISDGINVGVGNVNGLSVIAAGNHVAITTIDDPMMSSILADLQSHTKDSGSALTPTKLHRAWGFFETLKTEDHYQIKKLTVAPKSRLSMQKHQYRSEHWVVLSGIATVIIDGETEILHPSQSTFVPCQTLHRLANNEDTPLVIIELQIGEYLGEDDIERFEDDYLRD